MFCRDMEIGLLGSRNAYSLKEPYILGIRVKSASGQVGLSQLGRVKSALYIRYSCVLVGRERCSK